MRYGTLTQVGSISRRTFCRSAVATVAVGWAGASAGGSEAAKRVKFYKNLSPGHIGVRANQRQLVDYAAKYGFGGISPSTGEFADKSTSEIRDWLATMQDKGVRYGAGGLPVEFRRDDDRFRSDMAQLPKQAGILHQMGVTRVATWLLPGHNELTYLQNFKQHETRLREAAKILKDHDIRLGLEFVGPRTSRARFRFPFACTQMGMMELVDAIGTGNVGLLLDSWHWYTSHGTVEEMQRLSGSDIIHVHVNDAPAGVPVDEQVDNRRKLPVTTGVVDMKGFLNTLAKISYDGPVECEPFDQDLREMDDDAAVKKTAEALDRAWALIDA